MLFHKKNKKIIKVVWMVLCVIIILSMVMVYVPIGR